MRQKYGKTVLLLRAAAVLAVCFLWAPARPSFADTLKSDKTFVIQGKSVRFLGGIDIKFHSTGAVERGFLARDTDLPVSGKPVTFGGRTMIAFYRGGNVRMGFLGDWAVLRYKGKKLIAPRGSYVEFDPAGELVKHVYTIIDILAARCRHHDTNAISSTAPVSFTPDGRFVIIKNLELPYSLWDVQNGRFVRFLDEAPLAFSPDGGSFLSVTVSGDEKRTVHIRDVQSWKEKKTIKSDMGRIHLIAYCADGKKIMAVHRNTEIKTWNAVTGKLLKTVQMEKAGHKGHVYAMKFSPDGRFFASGGKDWTVRIWETDTGNLVKIINPDGGYISALDFSPDSGILAAACKQDNIIMLYDTKSWGLVRTIKVKSRSLYHTEFSPHGRFLLSAGQSAGGFDDNWQENLALKLWDVKTGKLVRVFSGHHQVFAAAFSRDGRRIVSAGNMDKTFKLWDTATGRLIATFMPIGRKGDWMLFTPAGYFNCSRGAYDYESMSYGTGYVTLTLRDFGPRYHKPETVARYLKGEIPPPPGSVLFELSHFDPRQQDRSWYVRYQYDKNDRRVRGQRYKKDGSPDGYYLYEYDTAERIKKESYYDNKGRLQSTLLNEYNQANEKVRSELRDAEGRLREVLKYEYGNRVAMFTGLCLRCRYYDADGKLLRYGEYWYDQLNRITSETFFNPAKKQIYKHKFEYGDLTALFYTY